VFVERKTHRESWKGEESVKERFAISEDKVVPFLEMEYTLEQVRAGRGVGGESGVTFGIRLGQEV
jgi:SPX domain protein involved in polyphosphate accumulation